MIECSVCPSGMSLSSRILENQFSSLCPCLWVWCLHLHLQTFSPWPSIARRPPLLNILLRKEAANKIRHTCTPMQYCKNTKNYTIYKLWKKTTLRCRQIPPRHSVCPGQQTHPDNEYYRFTLPRLPCVDSKIFFFSALMSLNGFLQVSCMILSWKNLRPRIACSLQYWIVDTYWSHSMETSGPCPVFALWLLYGGNLHAQSKLYKRQTSHTVAVFEAIVSCASQLLMTAVRPQQQMLSRSDTFALHQFTASAGKIDGVIYIFRHQVCGLTAVLFCNKSRSFMGF